MNKLIRAVNYETYIRKCVWGCWCMQQNVWGENENVMAIVWCVCVSEIVHFQTFLSLRISSLLITNFGPVAKRYVLTVSVCRCNCTEGLWYLCITDYVLDSQKLRMKVLGVYVQLQVLNYLCILCLCVQINLVCCASCHHQAFCLCRVVLYV